MMSVRAYSNSTIAISFYGNTQNIDALFNRLNNAAVSLFWTFDLYDQNKSHVTRYAMRWLATETQTGHFKETHVNVDL